MGRQSQEFSARWSVGCWILTVSVALLVFLVVPVVFVLRLHNGQTEGLQVETLLLLVPIVFLIAILFAPTGYSITNDELVVCRRGRNIKIACGEVQAVTRTSRKQIGYGTLRICGVGGFFGSYGIFYSFRIGLFRAYVTNRDCFVLITHHVRSKYVMLFLDAA